MRMLLVALISLGSLAMAAEKETIEREVTLDAGGSCIIKNINGNIQVKTWDKNRVKLEAVKKARGSNAAQKLANWDVEVREQGDTVEIEAVRKRKLRNNNVSIQMQIWVPREAHLKVKSTNGNVSVEDVTGKVEASTTNGNVRVENISGSIDAHTTNGNIDGELASYDGSEMSLKTTNGSINLKAPESLSADLNARVTNGRIHCAHTMKATSQSRRSLEAQVNGGGSPLNMKTTNGSISLETY